MTDLGSRVRHGVALAHHAPVSQLHNGFLSTDPRRPAASTNGQQDPVREQSGQSLGSAAQSLGSAALGDFDGGITAASGFAVSGWFTGWKAARLCLADDPAGVSLQGAWSPLTFGLDDTARCYKVPVHVPPHEGCRCGFHAWHTREQAEEAAADAAASMLLIVALAGRIDVYERGLIAHRQQVQAVWLRDICSVADREACEISPTDLTADRPADGVPLHRVRLRPWCGAHRPVGRASATPADIATGLHVPVHWHSPTGVAEPATDLPSPSGPPHI